MNECIDNLIHRGRHNVYKAFRILRAKTINYDKQIIEQIKMILSSLGDEYEVMVQSALNDELRFLPLKERDFLKHIRAPERDLWDKVLMEFYRNAGYDYTDLSDPDSIDVMLNFMEILTQDTVIDFEKYNTNSGIKKLLIQSRFIGSHLMPFLTSCVEKYPNSAYLKLVHTFIKEDMTLLNDCLRLLLKDNR
ncbi:MAG: hypothetical protein ACP5OK_07205 [Thermoprotei archaeon]